MIAPLASATAGTVAIGTAGRCGLLVSVRDAVEAEEALCGGATIVDVKEPDRGPLGAADPAVAAWIAAVVGRRAAWTLACGELRDGVDAIHARLRHTLGLLAEGASPPAAAKAGLAGIAAHAWQDLLAAFAAGLPGGIAPVAVAYADWRRAAAPSPEAVVMAAAGAGIRLLLVDTFDKTGPGVMTSPESSTEVAVWVRQGREAGMRVVVAGSLNAATVPAAVACGPDVIAVRSAACVGGRFGRVCRKRVGELGKLCGLAGLDPAGEAPE